MRFFMSEVPHVPHTQHDKLTKVLSTRLTGFRGGLIFKAHRLLYLSTLVLRAIKKKTGPLTSEGPAGSQSG